jgi:hypothetical protein
VETDLPVILAIWPPNAIELSDDPASPHVLWWRRWNAEPRIEITFNHQMAKPALANADPWLRVYQIHNYGSNEIQLQKLVINHAGPAPGDGELGIPGFTEIYGLEPLPADPGQTPPRFLVLIRAEGTAIQDTSSPPLLLDAEYAGTKLTTAQVDEIWKIEAGGLPWLWDALADTGATLPQSGNGVEGGRFESWFSAVIIQG